MNYMSTHPQPERYLNGKNHPTVLLCSPSGFKALLKFSHILSSMTRGYQHRGFILSFEQSWRERLPREVKPPLEDHIAVNSGKRFDLGCQALESAPAGGHIDLILALKVCLGLVSAKQS